MKRGSELGRFDQFWDDDFLFQCRYSRSKWLLFKQSFLRAPLDIYSHALKGNKNIIHITFVLNSDLIRFPIRDLPWEISISVLPAIHDGPGSDTNIDLIAFAKEIRTKMDPSSSYIFTDACGSGITYSGGLRKNARILISFVAPTSNQSLILRLKHSGDEGTTLEVTLGPTIIQLDSSSKSSLTIDDITLYPTPGPDRLSFKPGWNDIVIQFGGTGRDHDHFLHDIELLDEASLKDPRKKSNHKPTSSRERFYASSEFGEITC